MFDQSHVLVLDIAGPADKPDPFAPLVLRKPDPKRFTTQTWRFSEDGRLCCQYSGNSGLYVQAKEGCLGLGAGQDLVLGPTPNLCLSRTDTGWLVTNGGHRAGKKARMVDRPDELQMVVILKVAWV